jgi:cobalamin biosynthesis Mg chelatase CobN
LPCRSVIRGAPEAAATYSTVPAPHSPDVQSQTETTGAPAAASTPIPSGKSSPSATPSGNPVNPGTGEPAESEANRINFAPYVTGGVVLVALLAAFLWWRRRRGKTVV